MSHVATVELEVKDLGALKEACAKLGLEFAEGVTQYRWFGTHVGDYPLPAGFTAEDLGSCEHVLRIPNAGDMHPDDMPYEVGIAKRRDGRPGYLLLWDFWNGGNGLEQYVGADCRKLKVQYALAVAKRVAIAKGFRINEQQREDGSVYLRCTK